MRPTTWTGFDTETYLGGVKVLCASDGSYVENPFTADWMDFLYHHIAPNGGAGVFYNLRYDVSCLLRQVAQELPAEVRSGDFVAWGYHVHYQAGKALTIEPEHKRGWDNARVIYDVAQFYPGGLDRAAQKVLGDKKNAAELGIDRVRIGNEAGYYEANRADIITYCIKDSDLAKRLMETFSAHVHTQLGIWPKTWYSGASVAKSLLAGHWINPGYRWPERTIRDTLAAYTGGIFDTRILGRAEVVEYDINSAYPWVIAGLPDLSIAEPVEVDTVSPGRPPGIYLVEVPYDGTLPYRLPDDSIIYPVSTTPLPAWLTSYEIERFPGARVVRGWEWPVPLDITPFRRIVEDGFKLRQTLRTAGDPAEAALKVALNSLYGTFAETKYGWTRHTNLM